MKEPDSEINNVKPLPRLGDEKEWALQKDWM